MTGDSVVIVENVHKEYSGAFPWSPRQRALQGISFSVQKGCILALLGPNGAGKSTTLHLLLGLAAPSSGSLRVCGHTPSSPQSRRSLGFLPEVFAFDRFVSGRKLLARFDALSGNDTETREQRVNAALALVNLSSDADRKVGSYSKGMTQRIGLAQALLGDPELLVLDEPMSGMDPAGRRSVKGLLAERRTRGLTVLFSSHILSDVEEIADHVVILSAGRIVANAGLHELRDRSRKIQVVFRSTTGFPEEKARRALGPSAIPMDEPGVFAVEVEDETMLQVVLTGLASENARVLSVNPVRTDLESLFLRLTGAGEKATPRE